MPLRHIKWYGDSMAFQKTIFTGQELGLSAQDTADEIVSCFNKVKWKIRLGAALFA
jgi:hypothetical protein